MDPITLIVTALVTGAAAGLKGTVEKALADAYQGITELIKRKYAQVDLKTLERDPASAEHKTAVKAELEKTTAAEDKELLEGAQRVLQAIPERALEATARAANVSIKDIKAGASARIRNIQAGQGGRIVIDGITAGQDIDISDLATGDSGTKM